MTRHTTAAAAISFGCLVVGLLTYAVVVSSAWVFAVLPLFPAGLLASSGLGVAIVTRRASRRTRAVSIAFGALLAAIGVVLTLAYFTLWGISFDYVDSGRDTPTAVDRWDQITFVGSAVACGLGVMLAIAVLGLAWGRQPRSPLAASTPVQVRPGPCRS